LHLKKDIRAVSTLLFILMIFASLIIGGLIAYIWAIAPYYNVPANPSVLSVENVVFSLDNFSCFNVTVLNPSYSVSNLNITGFQVNVESQNETFSVVTAEPALPFVLDKGTKQNFTCLQNWSAFAGQTITVEPVVEASSASVQSVPYVAPMVQLIVSNFSQAPNVNYFNLTVQNSAESVTNLTVSDITVFGVSVDNATPLLPFLLPVGQTQVFNSTYNWAQDGGENLTITVVTDVGYEQVYETSPIQSAALSISNVSFDNSDDGYFNIAVTNPSTSGAVATLSGVNVTLANGTPFALNNTSPPLGAESFVFVAPNETQNVECFWNWSGARDELIVVQAFTVEGFPVQNITVTTPSASIWSVNNVEFNLDDVEQFTVNVTNAPVSLGSINITRVDYDQYNTSMSPVVIAPGDSSLVVCSFNWTNFVALNANVTVYGVYVPNETTTAISKTLSLPYVKVADAQFSNFPTGNPYVNVTVFDSQYSPLTANITQISVTVNDVTSVIDGTLSVPTVGSSGYVLSTGEEVTFVCPWNWSTYSGQNVTFTVQLAQGPPVSATFQAPQAG